MYLAYVEYNTCLTTHLAKRESQVNALLSVNIYLKI